MKTDEFDFEELVNAPQFTSDLAFSLNGMSTDEYIAKVTDEINKINLDSVPIDRWDMLVTFLLASLEVAGDFFVGDPGFKNSLANKNGPFCKWLDKFHDKASSTSKWWGHKGSVLDYQGAEIGGSKGSHRGMTFAHDLPLARALYGAKIKEDDGTATKVAKHTYNGALIAHDLLCFSISLYSICTGKFVDCAFTKDGTYELIVKATNQNGTPYDPCNIFVGVVKYLVHMLADFCSSASLPIPGWSLLTHFPDRDVEAFAMKLYRNGMNLRTMALQSVPVGVTELLMSVYIWVRSKDRKDEYSEAAWENKKNKLLLIAHGITTAVNVGKVIITKSPWRLNLVVIVRTFQLMWKVIDEETKLTNNHILKLDEQILRARIESSKTLVLLDELLYETNNLNQLTDELSKRIRASARMRHDKLSELKEESSKLDSILED